MSTTSIQRLLKWSKNFFILGFIKLRIYKKSSWKVQLKAVSSALPFLLGNVPELRKQFSKHALEQHEKD